MPWYIVFEILTSTSGFRILQQDSPDATKLDMAGIYLEPYLSRSQGLLPEMDPSGTYVSRDPSKTLKVSHRQSTRSRICLLTRYLKRKVGNFRQDEHFPERLQQQLLQQLEQQQLILLRAPDILMGLYIIPG